MNVVFTSKGGASSLIEQAPSGACTEGWQYSSDGARVELCPDTCKRVQASDSPEVGMLFGCTTEVGPIH